LSVFQNACHIQLLCLACPAGWSSYNSSCYYVSTVAKKQSEARDDCQGFGGDLVSVENDDEMNYITSISFVVLSFYYSTKLSNKNRPIFITSKYL